MIWEPCRPGHSFEAVAKALPAGHNLLILHSWLGSCSPVFLPHPTPLPLQRWLFVEPQMHWYWWFLLPVEA